MSDIIAIKKALHMLDHVMLWIARGFAAFAAFFASCLFLDQGLFKGDILFCGSLLVAAIIWVACTWSLNQPSSRLFLGISSVIYLIAVLHLADDAVRERPNDIKFWIAPMVGSIAMIWVACRPLGKFQDATSFVNHV
jgi:phosphate/sulfate permease